MSDKNEPTTILGVNKRLRELTEEVNSNDSKTKKIIEAESNAAVHHVAEVKKEVIEMRKRMDSMEETLKLILTKLDQTYYRAKPTQFQSDEIQQDKGKSRADPRRVENPIVDAKVLPLGEGKGPNSWKSTHG